VQQLQYGVVRNLRISIRKMHKIKYGEFFNDRVIRVEIGHVNVSLQYLKGQAYSCHDLPQQLLWEIKSIYGRNNVTVIDYAMIKWNIFSREFYI
jgi:hypothetical protein